MQRNPFLCVSIGKVPKAQINSSLDTKLLNERNSHQAFKHILLWLRKYAGPLLSKFVQLCSLYNDYFDTSNSLFNREGTYRLTTISWLGYFSPLSGIILQGEYLQYM